MMIKRKLIVPFLAVSLSLSAGLILAANAQEPIYGSQLMTHQERLEYQARLNAANTAEERERIRAEHHERMLERARELGVKLPDMPSDRGGMRTPGSGMGKGGGMGSGGRGR